MARPAKKKKRCGVFIYCTEEIKKRLKVAAAKKGVTLSGYVMSAALGNLKRDEPHAR